MTVRVGEYWSDPRPVYGGVPQGSLLGVFLFNVATHDLEESSAGVVDCSTDMTADDSDVGSDEPEGMLTLTSTPAPTAPDYFLP